MLATISKEVDIPWQSSTSTYFSHMIAGLAFRILFDNKVKFSPQALVAQRLCHKQMSVCGLVDVNCKMFFFFFTGSFHCPPFAFPLLIQKQGY